MVVVRGSESSSNSLHHGCMNQVNQSPHGSIEVSQCLPSSFNIPQTTVTQHINVNQINLPNLNNVSVQYIPHPNSSSTLKHDQSSSRYSSSNCQLPSHHYRVVSQTRPVECYHPAGAAGTQYIPNTSGGVQTSGQPTLRVQPTPQPSAPPAPQQDISKASMAGHNYPSQNQNSANSRASQYGNFPYRQQQQQPQTTRSSTHPRQQQTQQQQPPYIPGATATTGPVVYPVMFQPPINIQSYQQPRPSAPYYPYLSYIGYNTPPGHTPQYYYTPSSPQLPSQNAQTNPPSRNNPATLGGAPCTSSVTAPTPTLPLQQPPTHIHPSISGTRANTQKHTHRIPIIDPVTFKNILTDIVSTDNNSVNDNNEQQIPQQPEPTPNFAEEFNRRVSEAAKQPSSDSLAKTNVTKNVEMPISSMSNVLSQSNAINYTNSNNKSEIYINENKILGPDVAAETSETPIVSAISDSPVIVPKMPMNVKQLQKNSDQSIVLDTNENIPLKQHKSKNVPQNEELDKSSSNISVINMNSTANSNLLQPVSSFTNNIMGMHHNIPVQAVAPTVTTILTPVTVPAHSQTVVTPTNTQGISPSFTNTPQTQRRETDLLQSEEQLRTEPDTTNFEKESSFTTSRPNGPASLVISSVDSLSNAINPPTSQNNKFTSEESTKNTEIIKNVTNQEVEGIFVEPKTEVIQKEKTQIDSTNHKVTQEHIPSSFENSIKLPTFEPDNKETSSAFDAQTKLTQSISSVLRAQQSDCKMKDINKTTDPDTANGNNSETTSETVKEDINKNDKAMKNQKNNSKKTKKMANNNKESESYENGKDETDKVVNIEENLKDETETSSEKDEGSSSSVITPKYKYSDDQWSPFNKAGKKYYDIDLLKQIKEDPLSKNKPEAPLLEAWNVIRTTPMLEPLPFANISRPSNDMFFPFGKSSGTGSRSNTPRDIKRDGRNITPSARGSMKMPTSSSSSSSHKPVIHVCLNDDVKLNESDSAWRPTRFVRPENVDEDEVKTQELYKKFRGILNKLTPQKFDTLLDKVKALDINNQKRLEGVIDLVFEKAIDEPNFSKAYAAMCHKLSKLKVPADNPSKPDQCVNFRALIINKCQNQFQTDKTNEQVIQLEKEIAECSDPAKKKELQAMVVEEHRRIRMRSVGNVRFIGELYKLKMLTVKIMEYCMNYLIDILEEEKLECLCKLLTTIGEQIENEPQDHLDPIFKKMQDIVDRRSNKISSRVRFMIQDVIELRKRKWVTKSVIDTQPKMMDQIQKEAEQQQRHIELMNANPMGGGGFRRDDGGRGKRGGDNRRPNTNSYMDNNWKTTRTNFAVDTSKLKAVSQKMPIKLAPHNSGWNHGSGTKNTAQAAGSSNSMISLTKNMYSILENVSTEPTSLRGTHDMTPTYHSKGASIERSTFNSRPEFGATPANRSDSMGLGRSSSGSRSSSAATPPAPVAAETVQPASQAAPVTQEPLPEVKRGSVKSMVDLCLIHSYYEELLVEFKSIFKPEHHASVISEIFNITFDKSAKEIGMIVNIVQLLVTSNTVSPDNLLEGMKETFDCAPDLHIDIPMLYDYLGKFVVPHIEKKHITFVQVFKLCNSIISSNHGHLLLKAIIRELKESMGPKFVKSKWQESSLKLEQWMNEDQVPKWIEDNKFEFLEGDVKPTDEENKKILTPPETQAKLLQLMNTDESCDCIKGWAQDKFGKSCNEEWFMRCLIQAICEHALFGPERRDVPHFNQDRMNKYASLIQDFGETKQIREAICLFGIQQLIQRLEHPQGLSLEIFQYLHDQYIISLEGFLAWWESDKEPEGKGVMSKALTSFFTSINAEVENEDSCSED